MKNKTEYGVCAYCGAELEPIWFTEEETVILHGSLIKTGRARRAVDYLICPNCLTHACCDDSFDGPWIKQKGAI